MCLTVGKGTMTGVYTRICPTGRVNKFQSNFLASELLCGCTVHQPLLSNYRLAEPGCHDMLGFITVACSERALNSIEACVARQIRRAGVNICRSSIRNICEGPLHRSQA